RAGPPETVRSPSGSSAGGRRGTPSPPGAAAPTRPGIGRRPWPGPGGGGRTGPGPAGRPGPARPGTPSPRRAPGGRRPAARGPGSARSGCTGTRPSRNPQGGPQPVDGPQPEPLDAPHLPVHSGGHLRERQALQVPQDEHLPVVVGEGGQGVGQEDGLL